MSDFGNHVKVARFVKAIARFPVDADESERAVRAVRTTLDSTSSTRRWFALSAVAAAVLVGIALLPVLLERSASAAEQLQKAGDATLGYHGWVHVEFTGGPTTRPTTTTAHASQHFLHFNTVDNTTVHETRIDGRRYIDMRELSKKIWTVYDPESNEVRISTMSDLTAAEFSREQGKMTPVTFDGWLREMAGVGVKPDSVKKSTEGGLARFDVTGIGAGKAKATVWVAPKTKLIAKSEFESAGERYVSEYSYGQPLIKDIFDVGAARDAKVIDGRPVDDVARVTQRLHQRAVHGFGDAVAVLTRQHLFDAGKGKANEATGGAKLFAREGNKLVQAHFAMMAQPENQNAPRQRGVGWRPASWPAPDLKDLLAATRDVLPMELMVVNGADSWPGGATRNLDGFEWRPRTGVAEQNLYYYNVGVLVWPSREYMMLEVPGTVVTIITDKARPGLIGVRCAGANSFDPGHRLNLPRASITFWIDPARDDMPIETIREDNPVTRGGLVSVTHLTFKEHAQLPDGRWYPTHWSEDHTTAGDEPDPERVTIEWRLGIYPGVKLDADWFEAPKKNHVDKIQGTNGSKQ